MIDEIEICRTECYVINMDKRNDRLALFEQNFKESGLSKYTRVTGIDGIDLNLINKYGLRINYGVLNKGEIGCLTSHASIYYHMIQNDIPYALIFEDDVVFTKDFLKRWNGVIDQIIHTDLKPNLVYLGGRNTIESTYGDFLETDINSPSPYYTKPVYDKHPPFLLNCDELVFMCAFGYCISLDSAKMMLSNMQTMTIDKPLDLYMTIFHHHTSASFKNKKQTNKSHHLMFYCDPLLCYSPLEVSSDIAKYGTRYK